MEDKVYDEGSDITAEEGTVHVDGPDGVDVRLTPDAALKISDQLMDGAMTAHGQRVERDRAAGSRPRRQGEESQEPKA